MKRLDLVILVVAVLIATQGRVHAYTDPGTGTLVWQLILAASFGVMFYLRRIVAWARGLRGRSSSGQNEAPSITTEQE